MVAALSADVVQERLAKARECAAAGMTLAQAAAAIGLPVRTLGGTLDRHGLKYGEMRLRAAIGAPASPPVAVVQPLSDRERRDAQFWQRKAADAKKQLHEAEKLVEELAGIRGIVPDPVPWEVPVPSKGSRSTLIVHTSDIHMGEVIDPAEVEGLNAYNPDIARVRMRRMFEAACLVGPRWMDVDECDGVLLTMGGDLVSGDIHEELLRTNALTSHEQVQGVIEIYDAGIRMLAEKFGRVHVVAVPGNHGRTTVKPTAKLASRLSYDIQAASILRDRFRGDARVTWQIAQGIDVRVILYGKTIMVTHGDRIGTGGGNGFAGPELPILRGAHKVRAQASSAALRCDLILMGHYHTSTNLRGVLANGSVPGFSEYGQGLRAALDAPRQWLARLSARWGLADTLAVQLDAPPEGKPRVRVTA